MRGKSRGVRELSWANPECPVKLKDILDFTDKWINR
ncbi:hypothetical protein PS712_04782 [Pseudomonas fluorescens]|jgi:hypothetical protein|uniref:Uncharacterized protein n=1 Tax=Pseudomonas fluorescens TaxID=294 RepID=A0A5E7EMT2_PSEFL|nr:hypothetical protein PS712_04782 [Pseudomonas fluorescens]